MSKYDNAILRDLRKHELIAYIEDLRDEVKKAQAQARFAHNQRTAYEEQYRQARDNYIAVAHVLMRVTPEELKTIPLHASTNELDKVLATATYQRERAEQAHHIITLLIDELCPHERTDHYELVVKALRVLGLTTAEIRLWFDGELIL